MSNERMIFTTDKKALADKVVFYTLMIGSAVVSATHFIMGVA